MGNCVTLPDHSRPHLSGYVVMGQGSSSPAASKSSSGTVGAETTAGGRVGGLQEAFSRLRHRGSEGSRPALHSAPSEEPRL